MTEVQRVLYISYDGMTDPLGQSQVLPYLIGLSTKGISLSLISFEKEERFDSNKHIIENICRSSGISWYPQKYTKRPPVISTIKDIRRMRRVARLLHRQSRFDLLHCRSYISALTGIWFKNKFGVPFVFDMRGFWADERVDGGLWSLTNPIYKIIYKYFKTKEKEFINESAVTISLTYNARNEILSWSGLRKDLKIEVIPCCVDLDLFDPKKLDAEVILSTRKELGLNEADRVLTYIGSLGTWYLLDEMLMFFNSWLKKYPSSIFVFVTLDSPQLLERKAKLLGIPKEKLRIVKAGRKQVPLYISVGNYSLFFIKPAYSKKASSPTKQGEIMAMGKPIICNSGVGDTDFIIDKYKAGYLVNQFDEACYDQVIQEMDDMTMSTSVIRAGAKAFYSLENGILAYKSVYQHAIK